MENLVICRTSDIDVPEEMLHMARQKYSTPQTSRVTLAEALQLSKGTTISTSGRLIQVAYIFQNLHYATITLLLYIN